MANFDYRKFLKENKSTFHSSLTEAVDVATVAQAVADAFTADDPLDIKYVITPGSVEGDLNGGGFDLDAEAGPNTPGEDWKDENGFGIDYYLGKYAGGSFVIKNEGDVSVVKNAAMRNAIIAYITPEGEIDMVFDVENHYNTMSDKLTGMKEAEEAKKPNKMKKSELKELIKSSIMNEMTLDVDKMEDAPESEVDFLAEVDRILAEADKIKEGVWSVLPARIPEFIDKVEELKDEYHAVVGSDDVFDGLNRAISAAEELLMNTAEINEEEEVAVDDTEVAVDGEENIDVDTTVEVDPNVKAVQDALTQAQAAAQKLGDEKLTDQIGNTITFFTRVHVVDKGAVAEGEEMKEGYYGTTNVEYYIQNIGYDSFEDFFNDNPGGEEVLIKWIESIPEFREMLMQQGMMEGKQEMKESVQIDAQADSMARDILDDLLRNGYKLSKLQSMDDEDAFEHVLAYYENGWLDVPPRMINKVAYALKSQAEGEESLNEDLASALTALIITIIAIPAIPISGALLMGLIDYLFNDLPEQRAEAKELRLYKGPDKQEKVLALAKEIESKLPSGKKRYLKTLVDRIGAAKLEDKAKEYRELDRYAQSQKLDENLATDIEAALKDLPIPSNEMEEGKKEYYKDAEADDAEHIKALEKDMEDDKKSSLKETLLLQKRAGILTESQYKEKMKEAEESVSQDTIQKAEKEAEKIANSSKFDAEMEKIWAKMSDEDKKNLQQGLKSAGILSESLSEGISFDTVLDKTQDIAATLEEADGDTAAKIGKIVGMVGKFNAMSFGIPGALVALAVGAPALTAIGVTGAGLLAGAALWWLGNKLSGGAVDRAF